MISDDAKGVLAERGVAEEVGEQRCRLFAIERAELDRPPPAVRAEESGRRLGELGPGRADDREPRLYVVGRDDVGDQVEQRGLGPVEVLEDQRRGLL